MRITLSVTPEKKKYYPFPQDRREHWKELHQHFCPQANMRIDFGQDTALLPIKMIFLNELVIPLEGCALAKEFIACTWKFAGQALGMKIQKSA